MKRNSTLSMPRDLNVDTNDDQVRSSSRSYRAGELQLCRPFHRYLDRPSGRDWASLPNESPIHWHVSRVEDRSLVRLVVARASRLTGAGFLISTRLSFADLIRRGRRASGLATVGPPVAKRTSGSNRVEANRSAERQKKWQLAHVYEHEYRP